MCAEGLTEAVIIEDRTMDAETYIKNKSTSIKTKLPLLRALIWPIATYGSQSWTTKKADERRINAFEMWRYRKILRKPYTEKSQCLVTPEYCHKSAIIETDSQRQT